MFTRPGITVPNSLIPGTHFLKRRSFTVYLLLSRISNKMYTYTSYESFYAYPMPGINLTLGVRVQFNTN